jgi:hypothetical protein
MEDADDDSAHSVAPSKVIELGDSSDDEEDCSPLVTAGGDNDSEGSGDEDEDKDGEFEDDVEEPEESAESELG